MKVEDPLRHVDVTKWTRYTEKFIWKTTYYRIVYVNKVIIRCRNVWAEEGLYLFEVQSFWVARKLSPLEIFIFGQFDFELENVVGLFAFVNCVCVLDSDVDSSFVQ